MKGIYTGDYSRICVLIEYQNSNLVMSYQVKSFHFIYLKLYLVKE